VLILIVCDIVIVGGAIIGYNGIRKRKPCLIFLFSILVVVFIIIFGSIGIAAKYIPQIIL
jgi:hypothetical protein